MSESGLTSKQRKAVMAYATSASVPEAAETAGCHPRTLYRWLTMPNFRQAVIEAEGEMLAATARQLARLHSTAINTLDAAMQTAETESVRVSAAKGVLQFSLRYRELIDLDRRLTEVERLLKEGR